jgi:hypothetical protein
MQSWLGDLTEFQVHSGCVSGLIYSSKFISTFKASQICKLGQSATEIAHHTIFDIFFFFDFVFVISCCLGLRNFVFGMAKNILL